MSTLTNDLKQMAADIEAFLGYYLEIMKGLPQKVISKIMTILWRYDFFGAKW